jgi:hypothetical protein
MGPVNPKSIIGEGSAFAPEQIDGLLNQLAEPFPPELVAWRVTATTRDRRGNRGQVVAYADQRAYTDRLNNIFTPLGWTREYTVQTVQNFERPQRNESGAKDSSIAAKVMVTCRVTIFGMGTHSGTGEEWATDENALTRAEAQAFKRACSCFGLGRYFYDLPRTWVDLDDQRRPLEHPRLPDWALPKQTEPGRNGTSGNGTAAKLDSAKNGKLRQNGKDSLYRNELLAAVRKFSEEIGYSLSREALRRMAGTEDLDHVQDLAKLSGAMERMQDVARGVARLKSAREVVGDDQYRRLCIELDLPSDSIDDIPTREVLRTLVTRMEELRDAIEKRDEEVVRGDQREGAPPESIDDLKARLLVQARRTSAAVRKSVGDVVQAASNGTLRFADVGRLTESQRQTAELTLQELERMVG